MVTVNNRVGESMPVFDLFDLQNRKINPENWLGDWTLLIFLRHLG